MKKTLIQRFVLIVMFGYMTSPAIAQTRGALLPRMTLRLGESCPILLPCRTLGAVQTSTNFSSYNLRQGIGVRTTSGLVGNTTSVREILGEVAESPPFIIVSETERYSLTNTTQPDAALSNATEELILDDGSSEDNAGPFPPSKFIILNRFSPDPSVFPLLLTDIQVYFDSVYNIIGDEIVLALYENTTNNTDPATGAKLLIKYPVSVQAVDDWNTFMLPAEMLLEGPGDVLIGVIFLEIHGMFHKPAPLDTTTSQERSWMGFWNESLPEDLLLPPNGEWGLIDRFGYPGNWLVRGSGITIHNSCYYFPLIFR